MSDDGRSAEELVTALEDGAVEVVAEDAALRLAPVCAGWPAERFRALVLHVATVRLHYGIPRVEYEALRRARDSRHLAAPDGLADAPPRPEPAAVAAPTPSPVELPGRARGFPGVLDRPASAPT